MLGEVRYRLIGALLTQMWLVPGTSSGTDSKNQERAKKFKIPTSSVTNMAQETCDTHGTGITTLENLQYRLQRLEYFISGSDNAQEPLEAVISKGREHNITSQLAKLEKTLHSLSEQSPIIDELLQLRMSPWALSGSDLVHIERAADLQA